MSDARKLERARDLLAFIDAAPTPYHAVKVAVERLTAAGFSELDERTAWRIEPGGRHYLTRGGGTLVAFVAGTQPPADAGFLMLGAHTDSPNLRLKPHPEYDTQGYRQLSVEVYGGVLWSTWLDRDLALGGRVTVRGGQTRLVRLPGVTCRIPNVAIHLNREVNTGGLTLNAQNHLSPLTGLTESKLELSARVAEELSKGGERVVVDDVRGFDLCLFDAHPAALGGLGDELLLAPRLDNLASCHAALTALVDAGDAGRATRVVALYDHEEVGSQSAAGARSRFLHGVLDRIAGAYGSGVDATPRAIARSLQLSADMAHALHPNYAEKHDKQHSPRLGSGPVIKVNVNQSYATDGPGVSVFVEACQEANAPVQRFSSRNDLPCGSTIGPISAASLGMRTVDIGNPMLSMHSCRELAASADVDPMIRALTVFLRDAVVPPPRD